MQETEKQADTQAPADVSGVVTNEHSITVCRHDPRLAQMVDRRHTIYRDAGENWTREQMQAATWAWLKGAVEKLISEGLASDESYHQAFAEECFDLDCLRLCP